MTLEYTDNFNRHLKEWRRENKATHRKQVDFYSRKLCLSEKKVEGILKRGMGIDAAMSAKEALRIGLITVVSDR
jgi:hypothetical protein